MAQDAKLLMFRGLLSYGPDGQMRGELAERWERAEDGAWVFHLREAVFHNGNPVTADDVRYSIEQMAAEKSQAYMKGEMQRIASIETPDARTVRLFTKEPAVVLPNLFAGYFTAIVARGSVDNNGPGIGAGPFVLVGQERGTYVDLKAFDRYYRPGLPKLRTIRLVAYADEDARVSALKAGDVDLIEYVPWAAMAGLQADPAFRLETTEGPFMYMYFNCKAGPFSDSRRAAGRRARDPAGGDRAGRVLRSGSGPRKVCRSNETARFSTRRSPMAGPMIRCGPRPCWPRPDWRTALPASCSRRPPTA